jgi:hypothetical protein
VAVVRRKVAEDFSPAEISGLALWLDASSADTLYTTDAGPVTAVSSPLDISGCALWLDGADASTMFDATSGGSQVAASGTIARWEDKSGNGRHLIQSTSTLRPTLQANGRNSRSVVAFDATDDYMASSSSLSLSQALTYIIVYKTPASVASGWSLFDSTTDRVHAYSQSGSDLRMYTAGGSFVVETGLTADQWRLSTLHFNGASSAGRLSGAQVASGTCGTNAANGTFNLGANNGGSATIKSSVAELIVLSGVTSFATVARIEAYLATKWGISGVHAPATATSDPVGYWADKSGNARHATQSTAASRPTISATTQNGRKALAFNGSSSNLTISNYSGESGASGLTRYMVMSATPPGGPTLTGTGGAGGTFLQTVSAQGRFFAGAAYSASDFGSSYTLLTSGVRVVGSVYNGAASGIPDGIRAYLDGALLPQVATSGTLPTSLSGAASAYHIGSNIGANNFFNGRTLEVLTYNRTLTSTERRRVEQYLATKYGITLAPQVSNADAQDWINRVYANGGSVSASTASAVNQFCNDIDAAGIRSSMYRANLFCGTGLNACLVPLYRGPSLSGTQYGNTTDTNSGGLFVAGDYSETLGLLGGGSRWLNTGFKPQDAGIPASSVHLSAVWSAFTHGTSANVFPLAMINANATERHWLNVNSNTTPTTEITASAGGNGATGSIVDTLYATNGGAVTGGLRTISRTTSSLVRLFLGATQRAQNTDAMFNTLSTENLSVFARWNGSTTFGHFAQRMMGYSAGLGMDSTQVAAFNTAITNFNAAMGRSI